MNFIHRGGMFMIVGLLMAAGPAIAVAPLGNATLEPSQIALGESAELTITNSGSTLDPVKLPQVTGLEFHIVGQSRRVQIINGAMLTSSSLVVRVIPQTVGTFNIPGITPASEPLVLRVNPAGNAPPGNSLRNGSPAVGGGSGAAGVRMTADGSAFVRLGLPKRDIYVGESIPVDIEVGLRDGFARLNSLPALTGGDFTLNNLSHQPEQTNKLIDGKAFTLVTWHSVIVAVKPGKFSLAAESPVTVRIRTRPQGDSMIDDMLGDPFLQNFFGATINKDLTVASPPSELTVLELPTEGRPPDFSGAVGQFKITSDPSSTSAAAGDPLTLRMHVTGSGNFDRVDSAMLARVEQWKTYPPKSSFKQSDALGLKGEKTFEQPLIASKPGTQTLPGLAFSYFDPGSRRYETTRSPPLDVSISPSLADGSLSALKLPAASASPESATASPHDGLRPDHVTTVATTRTLVPLYMQPRFVAIPSLLTLVFAAGWLGLRRASDPRDGRLARARSASKAAGRILKDMQAAARAGDSALFFNLARTALLQSLADRWQVEPDEITLDEIETRLGTESDDIRRILALADEANYSGRKPTSTDFDRWTQIVQSRLAGEERS